MSEDKSNRPAVADIYEDLQGVDLQALIAATGERLNPPGADDSIRVAVPSANGRPQFDARWFDDSLGRLPLIPPEDKPVDDADMNLDEDEAKIPAPLPPGTRPFREAKAPTIEPPAVKPLAVKPPAVKPPAVKPPAVKPSAVLPDQPSGRVTAALTGPRPGAPSNPKPGASYASIPVIEPRESGRDDPLSGPLDRRGRSASSGLAPLRGSGRGEYLRGLFTGRGRSLSSSGQVPRSVVPGLSSLEQKNAIQDDQMGGSFITEADWNAIVTHTTTNCTLVGITNSVRNRIQWNNRRSAVGNILKMVRVICDEYASLKVKYSALEPYKDILREATRDVNVSRGFGADEKSDDAPLADDLDVQGQQGEQNQVLPIPLPPPIPRPVVDHDIVLKLEAHVSLIRLARTRRLDIPAVQTLLSHLTPETIDYISQFASLRSRQVQSEDGAFFHAVLELAKLGQGARSTTGRELVVRLYQAVAPVQSALHRFLATENIHKHSPDDIQYILTHDVTELKAAHETKVAVDRSTLSVDAKQNLMDLGARLNTIFPVTVEDSKAQYTAEEFLGRLERARSGADGRNSHEFDRQLPFMIDRALITEERMSIVMTRCREMVKLAATAFTLIGQINEIYSAWYAAAVTNLTSSITAVTTKAHAEEIEGALRRLSPESNVTVEYKDVGASADRPSLDDLLLRVNSPALIKILFSKMRGLSTGLMGQHKRAFADFASSIASAFSALASVDVRPDAKRSQDSLFTGLNTAANNFKGVVNSLLSPASPTLLNESKSSLSDAIKSSLSGTYIPIIKELVTIALRVAFKDFAKEINPLDVVARIADAISNMPADKNNSLGAVQALRATLASQNTNKISLLTHQVQELKQQVTKAHNAQTDAETMMAQYIGVLERYRRALLSIETKGSVQINRVPVGPQDAGYITDLESLVGILEKLGERSQQIDTFVDTVYRALGQIQTTGADDLSLRSSSIGSAPLGLLRTPVASASFGERLKTITTRLEPLTEIASQTKLLVGNSQAVKADIQLVYDLNDEMKGGEVSTAPVGNVDVVRVLKDVNASLKGTQDLIVIVKNILVRLREAAADLTKNAREPLMLKGTGSIRTLVNWAIGTLTTTSGNSNELNDIIVELANYSSMLMSVVDAVPLDESSAPAVSASSVSPASAVSASSASSVSAVPASSSLVTGEEKKKEVKDQDQDQREEALRLAREHPGLAFIGIPADRKIQLNGLRKTLSDYKQLRADVTAILESLNQLVRGNALRAAIPNLGLVPVMKIDAVSAYVQRAIGIVATLRDDIVTRYTQESELREFLVSDAPKYLPVGFFSSDASRLGVFQTARAMIVGQRKAFDVLEAERKEDTKFVEELLNTFSPGQLISLSRRDDATRIATETRTRLDELDRGMTTVVSDSQIGTAKLTAFFQSFSDAKQYEVAAPVQGDRDEALKRIANFRLYTRLVDQLLAMSKDDGKAIESFKASYNKLTELLVGKFEVAGLVALPTDNSTIRTLVDQFSKGIDNCVAQANTRFTVVEKERKETTALIVRIYNKENRILAARPGVSAWQDVDPESKTKSADRFYLNDIDVFVDKSKETFEFAGLVNFYLTQNGFEAYNAKQIEYVLDKGVAWIRDPDRPFGDDAPARRNGSRRAGSGSGNGSSGSRRANGGNGNGYPGSGSLMVSFGTEPGRNGPGRGINGENGKRRVPDDPPFGRGSNGQKKSRSETPTQVFPVLFEFITLLAGANDRDITKILRNPFLGNSDATKMLSSSALQIVMTLVVDRPNITVDEVKRLLSDEDPVTNSRSYKVQRELRAMREPTRALGASSASASPNINPSIGAESRRLPSTLEEKTAQPGGSSAPIGPIPNRSAEQQAAYNRARSLDNGNDEPNPFVDAGVRCFYLIDQIERNGPDLVDQSLRMLCDPPTYAVVMKTLAMLRTVNKFFDVTLWDLIVFKDSRISFAYVVTSNLHVSAMNAPGSGESKDRSNATVAQYDSDVQMFCSMYELDSEGVVKARTTRPGSRFSRVSGLEFRDE